MSVQDYMSASKIGKRAYHACVNKGRYPYLPVLENIVDESDIEAEVSLGIDQIPLRLVVGTCNAGRTNAFADNFMPILNSLVRQYLIQYLKLDVSIFEYEQIHQMNMISRHIENILE